jgi:hypothetical protein
MQRREKRSVFVILSNLFVGIHPQTCRFHTASNPEMVGIFVLSIKSKII